MLQKRAACRLVMDDSWGTVAAADPMISRAGTQHNHPRDACRIRSSSSGRNPAGIMNESWRPLHSLLVHVGRAHAKIRPSPPLLVFFTNKAWMRQRGPAPTSCPLMHSLCAFPPITSTPKGRDGTAILLHAHGDSFIPGPQLLHSPGTWTKNTHTC